MATMGLRAASRLMAPLVSYQRNQSIRFLSRTFSINSEQKELSDLVWKEDPDSFGMISRTNKIFTERYEKDQDDLKEEKYISENPLKSAKLSTKQYADLIKDHLQNKRIKEALDVVEVRMLQEDRVRPENYIYNLLIGGCARVGYTKKAFRLFNDMKKRGLPVTGGTYTSLFNACSNSPWIEDGLQRAKGLRELMIEKQYEPNVSNYNSMIKAFGRCGDLLTAFQIVDEMCSKGIKISVHTFNFLLQSCITDKTSGFRHGLLTWRKMLKNKERPNIYSFNLMLRCIKECGIGKRDLKNIVENIISEGVLNDANPKQKLLSDHRTSEKSVINNNVALNTHSPTNTTTFNGEAVATNTLPNLLAKIPHMGNVISLTKVDTAEDRFMLVGGMHNFLNEMDTYKKKPDIKTITQMLHIMPNTLETEKQLLEKIKEYNVKTDIDFYNMLIKRRCYRFDYDSLTDIKLLIENENKLRYRGKYTEKRRLLNPDIITYGVLALSCNTKEKAIEFIKEIKDKRIKINSEILGTLLQHGKINFDIHYIFYIMDLVKEENLPVNQKFLKHLENIKKRCKELLKNNNTSDGIDTKPHKKFLSIYKKWIDETRVSDAVETEHPWTQFRVNQPETFQRPRQTKTRRGLYRKRIKYPVKI